MEGARQAGRDLDLLAIGEINPDVVVVADDPVPAFGQEEKLVSEIRLTVGSSSVIFACGAARLGLRTAFVGVVGDDAFGRYMLEAMQERGLDVSACVVEPRRPTGASVILSGGADRAILTATGTIGTLRVEQVPRSLLRRARHLHVGSYFLQDAARADLPRLFLEAQGEGLTTSFDCNWDPSGRWNGGIDAMLGAADLFFLNSQEARSITGREGDEAAARELAGRAAASRPAQLRSRPPITVALKRGAEGALALCGREMEVAPAPAVRAVDTTGAGDSFDAGFLYAWLRREPLRGCLRLGVACGSLSTRQAGGTAAQPTLAEAMSMLSQAGRNAPA